MRSVNQMALHPDSTGAALAITEARSLVRPRVTGEARPRLRTRVIGEARPLVRPRVTGSHGLAMAARS